MPDYDLGTARGKIELDASSLGRASAAFTGLGKVMIGVGALAVGAFAYAVKSAADFEKVMSAVGAVSNATAAEMEQLKEVALDLGSTTVYGANEIGRAMEQLAKAGLTIPEILNGATEATVTLAAAAGDELAGGIDSAAIVIANAMKTFGAGADEMDHFADVLVGAAASSTLSVDDIATSMTYAGPVAASLGLSIDDLSTALAILGDRGIRGSTAGTSLRGVFLGLATQTPKATKVLKELGIVTEDGTNRFFDMHGSLKPMPEIMQILGDATKDLSEQERIAAFNAIFQRRAMNSAMILAEQGAAGFDKYAAAIAKIDASDVAAKKLDNLSGDVTLLKNAFETLMIRVGLPFQEMLRGWVQGLNDFVRELNQVNPELLAQIALYAAVGGSILILVGSMLMAVGMVIKLYRNFIILMEAIKIVAAAVKLLTISFLTNPLFLFIAALVAVGVALYHAYHRSEEFRERVDAALRALEPAFNAVRGFIENFVEQFQNLIDVFREGDDVAQGVAEVIDNMFGNTGKLVGPIRAVVEAIQQLDDVARATFQYFADVILPVLWDFAIVVGQAVGDAVSWFVDEGIPAITDFARAIQEQLGMAIGWLNDNVAPIFTGLASLIAAAIDRIIRVVSFFGPIFKFVWDYAVAALRAAWSIINTIIQNILLVWGNFSDNIFRIITGAWERVKQTVESFLRIIQGVIQTFTGIISGDWSKAWGGIQEIFSGVWALMGDILQNAWFIIWNTLSAGLDLLISAWEVAWNTIVDLFGVAFRFLLDILEAGMKAFVGFIINNLKLAQSTFMNVWNAIYSWFEPKIAAIVAVVKGALDLVVQFFGGLWGRITGVLGDLAGKVLGFFTTAFNSMKEGAIGAVALLVEFVRTIPGKILGALPNPIEMLYSAGKRIVQGLINGIKSMIGAVGDAIGSVAGAIADALPGSPVKVGPLRVLNKGYAGGQIMKMLADGMKDQLPAIQTLLSMGLQPSVNPGSLALPQAATGRAPSPVVVQQGDTLTIDKVEIAAKDLQEMKDVKDFFDRVGQVARQGVEQ